MHASIVLAGSIALAGCSPPASPDAPDNYRSQVANGAELQSVGIIEGNSMSTTEISIVTERGQFEATLADNGSTRALARMLPLQLRMRDHLRQEKTAVLPSALPEGERQVDFAVGTLGLWGDRDFVIYYDRGQVPSPGIVILGHVTGDLSQFDNPETATVSLRRR
jgi:hypothetical protein